MNAISRSAVAGAAALMVAMLASANGANAGETPAPDGAKVYFVAPQDGATLKSPVRIVFGLSGMGVAPAGVDAENTGHHHLLVDVPPLGEGPDGADELDANIPSDEHHRHFGKGQTETMLELAPGKHTLQLVLGDKDHIPHAPPVASQVITITVE